MPYVFMPDRRPRGLPTDACGIHEKINNTFSFGTLLTNPFMYTILNAMLEDMYFHI